MANDEYIVELRHITKRFPGIIANDDISLGIKKGEIFALLGENGAGKSTLMSMLFGMYEPDEGEIYIRGKLEHISSPNYATKLNIGMVHQHFKLVECFSVLDNIIMGVEPCKHGFLQKGEAREKVISLSEKYGLHVDPDAAQQSAHGPLHSLFRADGRQLVTAAKHSGEQGERITAEGDAQGNKHQSLAPPLQP